MDTFDRIVVLGGKNYINMIKEIFKQKEIFTPLTCCRGNGDMMKKLNDSLKMGVAIN